MLLPLIAAATAAELHLSAGLEMTFNDPFYNAAGLRLGAEVRPWPLVGLEVAAGGYPYREEQGWKPLTTEQTGASISPDLSPVLAQGQAVVRLLPIRAEAGGWARRLGLHAGVAALYTEDDAQAVYVDDDDPRFAATAEELHPGLLYGLSGEAARGAWGLRVRLEQVRYEEHIFGITEDRDPAWVGLDMTWKP